LHSLAIDQLGNVTSAIENDPTGPIDRCRMTFGGRCIPMLNMTTETDPKQ